MRSRHLTDDDVLQIALSVSCCMLTRYHRRDAGAPRQGRIESAEHYLGEAWLAAHDFAERTEGMSRDHARAYVHRSAMGRVYDRDYVERCGFGRTSQYATRGRITVSLTEMPKSGGQLPDRQKDLHRYMTNGEKRARDCLLA